MDKEEILVPILNAINDLREEVRENRKEIQKNREVIQEINNINRTKKK